MASKSAVIQGSSAFVKNLVVFVISMFPFIENKASVVLAAALNIPWYGAYLETTIGAFIPVPFLMSRGYVRLEKLRRYRLVDRIMTTVDIFVSDHSGSYQKRGPLALAFVVSVPFTGVGCWVGALIADILHFDKKGSAIAIFAGTAVSGLIVTGGTYGLFSGFRRLVRG